MRAQKFKLDCVKFKNSYILLIDDINFKLCLINFEYFFIPGVPIKRQLFLQSMKQ